MWGRQEGRVMPRSLIQQRHLYPRRDTANRSETQAGETTLERICYVHKGRILKRMAVHVGPLFDLSESAARLDQRLASPRRDKVYGSSVPSLAALLRPAQTSRQDLSSKPSSRDWGADTGCR